MSMSMMPWMIRDLMERPTLYDQHFGMGVHPAHTTPHTGYIRPFHMPLHAIPDTTAVSHVLNDKDSFKVSMDVHQFKPEELSVKISGDDVVIEGRHEERSDEHGYVSRHFKRRYRIPETVDKNALQSSLSSDGVLQLCAPKTAHHNEKERAIPITRTFKPALPHTPAKKISPATSEKISDHSMDQSAPPAENSHNHK